MSAMSMHPTFSDRAGYRKWIATWRAMQARHTADTRKLKQKLKRMQRTNPAATATAQAHKELAARRVMGQKMMTLLESAWQRMQRIRDIEAQLAQQMAGFPLTLENCPTIDFHFNKGSIEFPQLPMWTIKAKGRSYYIHHLDFTGISGTTRETPDHPATKGAIRFRHCTLTLNADGTAKIEEAVRVAQAA